MRALASLLLAACLPGLAEPVIRVPVEVRQGYAMRVEATGVADPEGLTATMQEKTIRLFRSGPQKVLGLMPAAATLAPGVYTLAIRDKSGRTLRSSQVTVTDAKFDTQNIAATKQMKSLQPLPDEVETVQRFLKIVSEERFWADPFLSPTPDCRNSPFGVQRLHNGKPTGNYHRGLDLRSPTGRPVKATADGVVKVSRMFRRMGGTVGIDHGQGVLSLYLHLSKVAVKEGTFVHRGDVVAYVGATGFATGPHLHWQVMVNGVPTNPLQWAPGIGECAPRAPARAPARKKRPRTPSSTASR